MSYNPNDNKTVDNIQYDDAAISDEGEIFENVKMWMPQVQSWSPVYKNLTQPFTFDNFTSPRLPIDLGPFDVSYLADVPRVLRMTIKPSGELTSYIPKELEPASKLIHDVLAYDRMINDKFENCEVHITTDFGYVEPNTTQRFPGFHVDGLQGGKFKTKLMAEHSYIISTSNPTEFCLQPFFIKHYDEDYTNMFKAFDQQAQEANIYTAIPNHLYLMDAYMVHRTPVIKEAGERGFIRITVANAPLPIEFNTLNPMIDQKRPDFKLDIRDWLRAPDRGVDYEFYGLGGKSEVKPLSDDPDFVGETPAPKKAKQDIGVFSNNPLHVGKVVVIENKDFPKVQPSSPTYTDMLEPFNPMKYTNPRLPIDLGTANVKNIQKCPNVLRMPLKWWGEDDLMLPEEFAPIKMLLERIFTYDKCHNPLYTEMVAHVTHDSRIVEKGLTHRFPGFHGDDLQGGAFPDKQIAAHSYILTTEPGTEFCLQPFFVGHIDDTFERHFTEFDKQAKPENIYYSKPGHVYLMDPYSVHRTPLDNVDGLRTFLRVTFSTPDMVLPHNSLNPMFADRQDEYDAMPMHHLNETWWTQASDKKVPYEMYGIRTRN